MPRPRGRRRVVQLDLRQAELGARQLAVIAGRLLRGRGVGGAGFLGAAGGLGGAALPIAGARQRGRVDAADADPRKMLRGGGRIGQEAQRDPARGELLFGLVDVAGGQCGVTRDQIGGAVLADVEHLARQQSPLDPPFVDIVEPVRVARRAQHQLRGFGEFLFAAQQLDPAEDIAGVATQSRAAPPRAAPARWRPCGWTAMRALASATSSLPSRLAARSAAASCSLP